MWFFAYFYSRFYDLYTIFHGLGTSVRTVPILGDYLSYPFFRVSEMFFYLMDAARSAHYWSDAIETGLTSAISKAIDVFNYAYGWLTSATNNALAAANSAWDYAKNTVWNHANNAWLKANEAYNYATIWLKSALDTAISTFQSQITAITSQIDNFAATIGTQINAINTWRNEILALIPSRLTIVDWIESSLGYLTGRAIATVAVNAASFADALWQCADAVVGKLTEYRR
jgi:hypothetical protein